MKLQPGSYMPLRSIQLPDSESTVMSQKDPWPPKFNQLILESKLTFVQI